MTTSVLPSRDASIEDVEIRDDRSDDSLNSNEEFLRSVEEAKSRLDDPVGEQMGSGIHVFPHAEPEIGPKQLKKDESSFVAGTPTDAAPWQGGTSVKGDNRAAENPLADLSGGVRPSTFVRPPTPRLLHGRLAMRPNAYSRSKHANLLRKVLDPESYPKTRACKQNMRTTSCTALATAAARSMAPPSAKAQGARTRVSKYGPTSNSM
jgi:hypothetical protein